MKTINIEAGKINDTTSVYYLAMPRNHEYHPAAILSQRNEIPVDYKIVLKADGGWSAGTVEQLEAYERDTILKKLVEMEIVTELEPVAVGGAPRYTRGHAFYPLIPLRKAAPLTQQQTADAIGVSLAHYQKIESGASPLSKAGFETVQKLAAALKVTLDELAVIAQ